MTDEQQGQEFVAAFRVRATGSETEEKTIILGQQPNIIIEPGEAEGVLSFSLDSTGLTKEEVVIVLETMANTLKDTELVEREEG